MGEPPTHCGKDLILHRLLILELRLVLNKLFSMARYSTMQERARAPASSLAWVLVPVSASRLARTAASGRASASVSAPVWMLASVLATSPVCVVGHSVGTGIGPGCGPGAVPMQERAPVPPSHLGMSGDIFGVTHASPAIEKWSVHSLRRCERRFRCPSAPAQDSGLSRKQTVAILVRESLAEHLKRPLRATAGRPVPFGSLPPHTRRARAMLWGTGGCMSRRMRALRSPMQCTDNKAPSPTRRERRRSCPVWDIRLRARRPAKGANRKV